MTTPYDTADEADPTDVHSKAATIKLEFNVKEVKFWFQQLEAKMRFAGIKSQWTKMQIVVSILPVDIASEIKDLLCVSEPTTTGENTCYIDCKKRLMEIYGPREEDAFDKATQLIMTSSPSHLCRQIIGIVCPKHPKLVECCSIGMISGLWRSKIPKDVRTAVAGMSLGGGNLEAVLRLADAVYHANHKKPQVAGISGGATADDPSVAAFNRNSGNKANKGQKKNQGQNQNAGNTTQARRKNKKKSSDNPPDTVCNNHYEYGKQAYCCLNPFECPWKEFIVPRPKK